MSLRTEDSGYCWRGVLISPKGFRVSGILHSPQFKFLEGFEGISNFDSALLSHVQTERCKSKNFKPDSCIMCETRGSCETRHFWFLFLRVTGYVFGTGIFPDPKKHIRSTISSLRTRDRVPSIWSKFGFLGNFLFLPARIKGHGKKTFLSVDWNIWFSIYVYPPLQVLNEMVMRLLLFKGRGFVQPSPIWSSKWW